MSGAAFPTFLEAGVEVVLGAADLPTPDEPPTWSTEQSSQATADRLDRPFFVEQQKAANWCWAAVGAAVQKYVHGRVEAQCSLAQRVVQASGSDCCRSPSSTACDRIQLMSTVLARINVPRRANPEQPQGPISFNEVKKDIGDDKPILCLLADAATRHFVVIVGWYLDARGVAWLLVDDPASGLRHEVPFTGLYSNFGGRRWHQTTRIA